MASLLDQRDGRRAWYRKGYVQVSLFSSNDDSNEGISWAPFHVKHAQLRWTSANTKHMHIRHPKQPVSKQSCSNIQLSSKDGCKKKKKNVGRTVERPEGTGRTVYRLGFAQVWLCTNRTGQVELWTNQTIPGVALTPKKCVFYAKKEQTTQIWKCNAFTVRKKQWPHTSKCV